MTQTLEQTGELEAIKRLCSRLPHNNQVVQGPGDDCAILRPPHHSPSDWLATSDPTIEGTHFVPGTPGPAIGHKAVGRVLSDIAAMGGQPLWVLINIVAPPATPTQRLCDIYDGATALANSYNVAIVGGDLARGDTLELHVFGIGTVPEGSALLRSGSKAGEGIYVTGTLGNSQSGRHLSFTPRIAEGIWLRENSVATAMIDLSDGIARDLRHITQMSKTGALLEIAALPLSNSVRSLKDERAPHDHALFDGEDFELLFTAATKNEPHFVKAIQTCFDLPCTRIGTMTKEAGTVECIMADDSRRALPDDGFTHFSGAQ